MLHPHPLSRGFLLRPERVKAAIRLPGGMYWLLLACLLAWPAGGLVQNPQNPEVLCAEIPPMCFNTPRGPSGFVYEIGLELQRRLGRTMPIRVVPLARMWASVQRNVPVVSLWVGRTPEREEYTVWIAPLLHDALSVYTLKGRAPADSLTQVRRLRRIGVNLLSANLSAARLHGLDNTEAHDSDEINGRMLLHWRIDGWISTRASVRHFVREQDLSPDAVVRGFLLADYLAYLAASRAVDVNEIALWRKAFQGMIRDGTYLAILKKYGVREVAVGGAGFS